MNNTQISKERNVDEVIIRKIRTCIDSSLKTKRCFLCKYKTDDTDEMIEHIIDEKNIFRIQNFVYETTNKNVAKDLIKLIISDILIL